MPCLTSAATSWRGDFTQWVFGDAVRTKSKMPSNGKSRGEKAQLSFLIASLAEFLSHCSEHHVYDSTPTCQQLWDESSAFLHFAGEDSEGLGSCLLARCPVVRKWGARLSGNRLAFWVKGEEIIFIQIGKIKTTV